jgi:elongator complex protein 3
MGWGEALMDEAERVAAERGMRRMVVMSALGTREYYVRLGYARDGVYVSKPL